jgi:ATP-dependent Clp protease protease subunit
MGKHSGHTWQEIEEYFLRDRYLNALEAKAFGLVDEVLGDVSDVVTVKSAALNVSVAPTKALPEG